MTVTKIEIRGGAYYDSVVLMQLQASLGTLPGVKNAGVVMGTAANKNLLKQNGLLTPQAQSALPDDLIISIEGDDEVAVETALSRVDEFLARRRTILQQDYSPKSLAAAAQMRPDAAWVLVSLPGRYAAGVAREALQRQKNVFLYSDHVSLVDELSLKKEAAEKGLLVMGPDCGTAIVNGVGLGFANRVRRGPIGLVGASGTGLQQVTSRIHQLGGGITHALGTGGRDLSEAVKAITARQSLDLLGRDPETKVIVLISKPPAPDVAHSLLHLARTTGKPVVVNFIGYSFESVKYHHNNLHFASSLDEAAELAVELVESQTSEVIKTSGVSEVPKAMVNGFTTEQRYLRGLFSGGSLAYEALVILQDYLPVIYSNIPLKKEHALADSLISQGHTIIDLGEDEFTVGRLHPMLDNTLRLQRLAQEASDPSVALILLDLVLGYGAHPDPASDLGPAIAAARAKAKAVGRELEVVAVVVGTDEDPQDLAAQVEQLKAAGAHVETSNQAAAVYAGQRLQALGRLGRLPLVDLSVLQRPLEVINVGLEAFAVSLSAQNVPVTHVDWRPPAGGNEKLMSILERMKKK
jgi:FdrA protein